MVDEISTTLDFKIIAVSEKSFKVCTLTIDKEETSKVTLDVIYSHKTKETFDKIIKVYFDKMESENILCLYAHNYLEKFSIPLEYDGATGLDSI